LKKHVFAAALIVPSLALSAPAHAVSFSRADANADGVVTFEEAERAFPRLSIVLIEKADRNGDGVIDKGEMPHLNSFDRFKNER
jgi:EF hand